MDLARQLSDDMAGLWRQVGNLTRAVSIFEIRFDRIDADIAGLKTDVAGLKTDVAGVKTDVAGLKTDVVTTKEQLNRLELAVHDQSNRMDAQFERIIGSHRAGRAQAVVGTSTALPVV